jgi:predicted DNA-binding transcriptional regulator AlpA
MNIAFCLELCKNWPVKLKEVKMANKDECTSIDQAADIAGVSRATLYNYMNVLGVQRIKFPFDRKAYITNSDLERVRKFIEQNK